LALLLPNQAYANELRVAVASNFKSTAQKLATQFEEETGHKVTLISGSTGSLYSLISHGAPYDIFLSADSQRPQKLVEDNLAYPDSQFVYAVGQLAYWSPNQEKLTQNNLVSLLKNQTSKLALANPRLAPYGLSTSKYLDLKGLSKHVKSRLVTGNNITQTLQFIYSGNAQSGFVSYSELLNAGIKDHFILLDPKSYPAINQQAVILRRTKELATAQEFMTFIKTVSCDTILDSGYGLAPATNSGHH